MSERRQHRNPWAEKLSQVSLPDGGESWKAMEAMLDRELPTGRGRDWRRWVLLILLLLLLIGVCNCPGRKWFLSGKTEVGKTEVSKTETVKAGGSRAQTDKTGKDPFPEVPVGEKLQGGPSGGGPSVGEKVQGRPSVAVAVPGSVKEGSANVPEREVAKGDSARVPKREAGTRGPAPVPVVAAKRPVTPSKDGEKKKDDEKKEKQGGWMVGVGLNQFFTVGSQQASSFNSGGITGTLGDYIPVPMVRYYFNPKLYVQLEAQINTPQYTKKNLVAVSTPVDSIGTTTGGVLITVQKSVSINKLFYFNIPISLHYTVFGHLDIGTGLQYSRLTNGIGVFNNNYDTGGSASLSTETKSFRGDSVYKEIKTHEFRFLVDANYTWQHFIFGIRYNQALSKFIHVEISPGQITQARNSSLQLYLRYILWDGRKKKPMLPAK